MSSTEFTPLYINPEHTRTEIERLLHKTKTVKVLLIFAGHVDSNINIIDLQLLSRFAHQQGKHLAIATRNAKLRDAADHLEINHFRTPSHARRQPWNEPHSFRENMVLPSKERPIQQPAHYQPAKTSRQWWEWAIVSLLIVIITAGGLMLFSRAEIIIDPIPQTQSLPLEITASSLIRSATLSGEIPMHSSSMILEITGSGEATGTLSFPEGYASGTLTITNLTEEPLDLPAGLIVQTMDVQPIQFVTETPITLEPAGEEGDSIKTGITAKHPGREGNVPAETILAASGEYGSSIAVNNTGATFGGYNRHVNTPSEQDIASLRESLIDELLQQAQNEYAGEMESDGFVLLADSIQIDEMLNEEIVPLSGEPAEEFHLTLRVRMAASYIDPADLQQTAGQLLDANIEDGFTASGEDIQITPVSPPTKEGETYHWSVLIHRQIVPDVTSIDLNAFAGQPRRRLINWLEENFSYIESIRVASQPGFWWRLPILPRRMEVIVL